MNSILSALFSASQISNKLKLPDIWQFLGFYRSSICKQILGNQCEAYSLESGILSLMQITSSLLKIMPPSLWIKVCCSIEFQEQLKAVLCKFCWLGFNFCEQQKFSNTSKMLSFPLIRNTFFIIKKYILPNMKNTFCSIYVDLRMREEVA